MARFMHTSDWQLGMTRHFLSVDAQARYSQARLDAVRRIATLARDEGCAFVVVCGDVFESNHVDRQLVVRALEAMSTFDMPLYLLPGNHDPIGAGSVYRSPAFVEHRPERVVVLEKMGLPVRVPGTDLELVAAPWESKRPLVDLVAQACEQLPASSDVQRVVVGHGAVDVGSPNPEDPALIHLVAADRAIRSGLVRYVALGDRHSTTDIGGSGRVWYSGTPLATDYGEDAPNNVLLVDLGEHGASVERRAVGGWRFLRRSFDLNDDQDIDTLRQWLNAQTDKHETIVKLSFVGTLSLAAKARLDAILGHFVDLFAALETWERHTELAVLPDEDDLTGLGLSGFAAATLEELAQQARSETPDRETAQDALGLLYRLAGARQ